MEKLLRILQKQYYLIHVLLQIQSGQDYEKIAKIIRESKEIPIISFR